MTTLRPTHIGIPADAPLAPLVRATRGSTCQCGGRAAWTVLATVAGRVERDEDLCEGCIGDLDWTLTPAARPVEPYCRIHDFFSCPYTH